MKTEIEIEILLVEDNPGDIRLTEVAIQSGKIRNKLNVVTDGEQALDYLYKKNKFSKAVRPDLILLDLNLPKKSGSEVLDIIKADKHLKHIPVIILTTSRNEEDILKSYQHYANAFITKPVDFKDFQEVVKKVEEFWFSIVKIPHNEQQ